MAQKTQSVPDNPPRRVNTATFAARNLVKPQTVRARYCRTGSYHGIKPTKLANGRQSWPDVQAVAASGPGASA